jgi:hypothetical protein
MKQKEFELRLDNWLMKVSDFCNEIAIRDDNYPDFYVFQTEVQFNPDLLIIGANPHGNATYKEKLLYKGIERRTKDHLINGRNMFIENPHWQISKPILEIFKSIKLNNVLKNSVIMNAVYFNSNSVEDLKKFFHGREMIYTCLNLTREFVYEILKPKNILFIGEDTPKWMKIKFNNIDDRVLENDGKWLIQKVEINGIPHYKIHHPSRNWKFNNGINLELKRRYFEEMIF